jgi:hypothetical protein
LILAVLWKKMHTISVLPPVPKVTKMEKVVLTVAVDVINNAINPYGTGNVGVLGFSPRILTRKRRSSASLIMSVSNSK